MGPEESGAQGSRGRASKKRALQGAGSTEELAIGQVCPGRSRVYRGGGLVGFLAGATREARIWTREDKDRWREVEETGRVADSGLGGWGYSLEALPLGTNYPHLPSVRQLRSTTQSPR